MFSSFLKRGILQNEKRVKKKISKEAIPFSSTHNERFHHCYLIMGLRSLQQKEEKGKYKNIERWNEKL